MVLPGPARLSVDALTWLLNVEQIGELHRVLAPTAVWWPPEEIKTVTEAAQAEITVLGWYDRRKRLEVEVAAALAVLCRAETEFYGWINHRESTIGLLAAAIGGQALLAVRDRETVWLKATGRSRLADMLIGQTADVPAGRGRPVSAARSDVVGSVRGRRLTEAAVQATRAGVAVERVQRMMALPATGGGELYAAVRDDVGRHRISAPLHYADTADGRYLIRTTPAGGQDQVTVAPATRADLVIRLQELHGSLTR
jgi:ESX secretion-associated protein EspG